MNQGIHPVDCLQPDPECPPCSEGHHEAIQFQPRRHGDLDAIALLWDDIALEMHLSGRYCNVTERITTNAYELADMDAALLDIEWRHDCEDLHLPGSLFQGPPGLRCALRRGLRYLRAMSQAQPNTRRQWPEIAGRVMLFPPQLFDQSGRRSVVVLSEWSAADGEA